MRLLEAFATAFINTFGITQPTEAQRRRAAWFILGMLVLTLSLVVAIGYAFLLSLHHHQACGRGYPFCVTSGSFVG